MNNKIVTVIGGSGFVGSYVCRELLKAGYMVNIASRNPDRALAIKTSGAVGQASISHCNIRNAESVRLAIGRSYAVVNLVGILYQSHKQKFPVIQAKGAETVAQICKEAGVERLIHFSALGVDKATSSAYARSKLNGEKAVMAAFPNATIIRPALIFGQEDNFFNKFARMAVFAPFLPLIGGGKTLFQPVYVVDIADAVVAILEQQKSRQKTYELGGPKVYSFKELLRLILKLTQRHKPLIPVPFPIAKMLGAFLEFLPNPPLTHDQVRLLQYDNTVEGKSLGFKSLGIRPLPLEQIVPRYLERYKAN